MIDLPWALWRGRVAAEDELASCVEELGLLAVQPVGGWPSLVEMLAPGVTTKVAWGWAGSLVARRQIYAGRALPGASGPWLTAMGLFPLVFARGPGSDPMAAYAKGLFGITGKAVVELLMARGPLTMQQIRLGLGQHKRFLIHDTPAVMAELERALAVVAGGQEMAAEWRTEAVARPRSRFNPLPSADVDLRVWELTVRWAPPAALAAADRLREEMGRARALLREHLAALNPGAGDAELDKLLGEDTVE